MAQKQVRLGAAIHARPKPRAHDRDSVAVSERRFRFIYVFPVRCFCLFSKDGPSRLPLTSFAQKSFIPITIRARKQEAPAGKVSKQQLVATTAAVALAAANPAHAGDLFGPEYAGAVGNVALFLGVGIGAISALFLPIICGTLNPVQIAINLGLAEGEVSNLRKFKRNGEPMDHGVKFGHKWYNTDAYCNGKYIDFAGTKKTVELQEK
jgi:centrosomal protein CEP164